MGEIVEILMKRDGISEQDAIEQYQETKILLKDAINSGDYDEAEEILSDYLCLEMDYIFNFI